VVNGIGDFSNDPSMTDLEIKTIVDWIDAGTPAGSGRDLPAMPSFPPVWKMGGGNPDVVLHVLKIGFRFTKTPAEKIALTGLSANRTFDIPPGDANYEAKGHGRTRRI
jgi:hypothetical protein